MCEYAIIINTCIGKQCTHQSMAIGVNGYIMFLTSPLILLITKIDTVVHESSKTCKYAGKNELAWNFAFLFKAWTWNLVGVLFYKQKKYIF